MKQSINEELIQLRFLVGYLGESNQYNWWQTNFMDLVSDSFLNPIFPRTTVISKYNGLKAAASRIHDDRISIGKNIYHLFRLPVEMESNLYTLLEKNQKKFEKDFLHSDCRFFNIPLHRIL